MNVISHNTEYTYVCSVHYIWIQIKQKHTWKQQFGIDVRAQQQAKGTLAQAECETICHTHTHCSCLEYSAASLAVKCIQLGSN